MKTNQVLTRKMSDFDVLQRTSDGMFNATTLLKQWNQQSGQQKKLDHFFENKSTQEFINVLINKECLHTRNSVYVKSRASRGLNAGTWMHPFLFIDFAMWLNAEFKYEVIKFVYDELIKYRNEAGDAYKEMASGIAKIVDKPFMANAMRDTKLALNYVIYNQHEPSIRNKVADENLLKELFELEKEIAKLIHFGFIKSFEGLKNHLRQRWCEKWQPKVLTALSSNGPDNG